MIRRTRKSVNRVSRRFNEASEYAQERSEKVNVSDIKISEGKSREFRVNSSAGYISLSAECPAKVVLRSFNNDDIELSENDAEVFIKLRIDSDMKEEIKELSDEAKKRWVDFSSLWITSRRGMDGILRTTSADNTIYTLEVKDVDETIDVEGVEFEVIGAGMAFDGRQVGATFDELVAMINEDYYESVNRRSIRSKSKREGVVLGDADEHIAHNIYLVISNEYSLYKMMRSLVESLIKKASKGVELDKDKLVKSSAVDQLVRQAIRSLQKDDPDGTFSHISTATRNSAKEYVADAILSEVDDEIRYANK